MTINSTERDERNYLKTIKQKLSEAIKFADDSARNRAKEAKEAKVYLYENKTGMDHVEKMSVRHSVTHMAITVENAVAKKKRYLKLLSSPYFGRLDFLENNSPEAVPLYLGIHTFLDHETNQNLIHDWRAPISTMFYDFELGKAHYNAPAGKVSGKISLKRQYRIRGGKMEYMLETSLNIHDDILQRELSQSSSQKMKNIVATIQREQNAIIRNEKSSVLVIQGVAGSGKTSIALHRIAFLLYRFNDSIKSEDILIISPNKVFADYISNVLPELGEEKIGEMGMEELASKILDGKVKFQTFSDQVATLLLNTDEAFQQRISFKSGFDFLAKLNDYLVFLENNYFKPKDFVAGRYPIPASYLKEKNQTYFRLPVQKRIAETVKDIVKDLKFYYNHDAGAVDRNMMRKEIEQMYTTLNVRQLYANFYDWLGKPEMLQKHKGNSYEYSDVFPLIYLKIKIEGSKSFEHVKHLVVDEMQDYTPVQYVVLARLFPGNKTILGDINQSVNPYSSTNAEQISRAFGNADVVKITKSYRSTYEIASLAQKIIFNPDLEPIERHGKEPSLHNYTYEQAELKRIEQLVSEFEKSEYKSLGIICKTQQQAEKLYRYLNPLHPRAILIDPKSSSFSDGITIATSYLAKGLEFDHVIVPFCSASNYQTITDKQMLYVAVTRAMHVLDITFCKEATSFFGNINFKL